MSSALIRLLTLQDIIKVGVAITGDVNQIKLTTGVETLGAIDIQHIARSMGIKEISMDALGQKFVPNYVKKESNDHGSYDEKITQDSIIYAANDARRSLQIYAAMVKIDVKMKSPTATHDELAIQWISDKIKESPGENINIDRLISQMMNSYGPYVKRYNPEQRRAKIEELLRKIGLIREPVVNPIVGMMDEFLLFLPRIDRLPVEDAVNLVEKEFAPVQNFMDRRDKAYELLKQAHWESRMWCVNGEYWIRK